MLVRGAYVVLYTLNLVYNMLKSAVTVCLICLTGGIQPEVVTVKTSLKKPFSQVVLANSITLTPGTLTIDVDSKKQELTVAILTPRPQESIIPFEKYIRGMLE